ncbi:MAG: exosortase/archaeosortase family protein [Planctomycetia bacterium]|nr:exosortase/archaeosortase family protein [Planctomycetia bacterium]
MAGAGEVGWDWNTVITPRSVIIGLVVLAPVVLMYWSDIKSWERTWRTDDNWGFGYFVLPLALWLLHMRFMEGGPQKIQPCWWGLSLVGFGLVVRLAGVSSMFGFIAQVSIIFVLAGMIMYLLGWHVIRIAWVPVGYLVLGIPWPVRVYDAIAQPLQRMAAIITELALSSIGIAVERSGNMLDLIEMGALGKLEVTGQCSGLRLLTAFVALGVLIAFIAKRAPWERIAIVFSTVPIALFCNSVRVLWMALWSRGFWRLSEAALQGGDVAKAETYNNIRDAVLSPGHGMFPGAPEWLDWHSSLGYVMLIVAFFLLWLETKFLDRLFLPAHKECDPAD